MIDTIITILIWTTVVVAGLMGLALASVVIVSLIRRNSLAIGKGSKRIRWGRFFLYIAFGGLVIGGLIFAYYQGWISIPPINRINPLPWLMLGFALFFMGVMLATSWGREVLGGVVFILGVISALILLVLAVFFPRELYDMFSNQPDEYRAVSRGVIVERLRLDHDYTYVLEPGDVRGFDRTRDDWCILFAWETEEVPDSWYYDWYEDGGDKYYLQNRYQVPVIVTVRMVRRGDWWKGTHCRYG